MPLRPQCSWHVRVPFCETGDCGQVTPPVQASGASPLRRPVAGGPLSRASAASSPQEPKTDQDEEHCRKVNEYLNNPPMPGALGASGSGGHELSALGGNRPLPGCAGRSRWVSGDVAPEWGPLVAKWTQRVAR